MIGLMVKDCINLKKNFKFLAAIIVVYGFMSYAQNNASFFSNMFIMVFALLVLSTYSFDEVVKWDGYALTMPISRKNIIQAKYGIMLFLTGIAIVISVITIIIINYVLKEELFQGTQSSLIVACIVIFFYCITIPIITKLGVEKARFIFLGICMIPFLIILLSKKVMDSGDFTIPDSLIQFGMWAVKNVYAVVPLFLIISLYVSYFISVEIYSKKEF